MRSGAVSSCRRKEHQVSWSRRLTVMIENMTGEKNHQTETAHGNQLGLEETASGFYSLMVEIENSQLKDENKWLHRHF